MGRRRRQLRDFFRARDARRAVPLRFARGGDGIADASRSPSRPTWSGTAICPTSAPVSCTAIACTDRTRRTRATASTRASCVLDPYAKVIGRATRWHDSLFGFRSSSPDDSLPDDRDSAPYAPLAAVVDDAFTWGNDHPPRTPWHETIIYELHVKGYTQLHPHVPEALRGTYLGLASEPAIRHLTSLGVTAVELMPVHHSQRRVASRPARADELLGLQHAVVLRARRALRRRRRFRSKPCASSR